MRRRSAPIQPLEMWRLKPAAPSRPPDLFKFDPAREGSKRQRHNTRAPQTFGERVLSDVPRGKREHGRGGLDFVGREVESVQTKKNKGRQNAVLLFPAMKG